MAASRYLAGALALMVASCEGTRPSQPSSEPESEPAVAEASSSDEPSSWETKPRWLCTWGIGKSADRGSCHNEQRECDKSRYVGLDRGHTMRPCEPVEHVHCFVQYDDAMSAHCHRSLEDCERGRTETAQWFRVGHCAQYGQRDSKAAIVSAVRGIGPDPDMQGPTRPLPANMVGNGWWCHHSDDGYPADLCLRSEPECETSRAQLQDGRFKPCFFQERASCVSWRDVAANRIKFACHATEQSCSMMLRFQASRPGVDGVGACASYK